MSVQRIGPNLYRSQPTNPVTGKRLNFYGSTPDECIARREEARHIIRRFEAKLITADECSTGLLGLEVRRVPRIGELWALWCDDLEAKARRGAITLSWARQCRACGALHLDDLAGRHPSELTAPVVEAWLQTRKRWHRGAGHEKPRCTGQFLSKGHQEAVWAKLSACIKWGLEERLVSKVPWSRPPEMVDRGVVERDATRDGTELAQLLDAASERDRISGGDLMLRVGIMSLLGVRAGEAVALAWDQVRVLPNGRVEVNIQFQRVATLRKEERGAGRPMATPKAGSSGAVTFKPDHPVVRLLAAQRARLERLGHYRSTGPVFPTRKGGWRGRDAVPPKVWRSLAREAGLERAGAKWVQHSARHSAGTLAASGGATRPEVRDMMRHKDLSVTEGYYHRAFGAASGDAAGNALLEALSRGSKKREAFALPAATADVLDPLDPIAEREKREERTEAEAARTYKARQLGRDVYDSVAAFKEWLAMGAPIEAPKKRGAREAPPLVRVAAKNAGERAVYKAEKLFPEDWEQKPAIADECRARLTEARERGERAALNRWKGLRKKEARAALGRGEALPLHVRDWLGVD